MDNNFKPLNLNHSLNLDINKLNIPVNESIQRSINDSIRKTEIISNSIYEQKQEEKRQLEEHYQDSKEMSDQISS